MNHSIKPPPPPPVPTVMRVRMANAYLANAKLALGRDTKTKEQMIDVLNSAEYFLKLARSSL